MILEKSNYIRPSFGSM